jgi:hypothetical protein
LCVRDELESLFRACVAPPAHTMRFYAACLRLYTQCI